MLTFTKNEIIDRIKEAIPEINKDITSYNFVEYKKYYAVQVDGYEPILFEKEQGFPAFKNFASVPESDLGKGKVLEEVGKTKSKKELKRFGTKGQKWGHRYHQSYETKPTRSGMIGEEHGDAAKDYKTRESEYKDEYFKINKQKNKIEKQLRGNSLFKNKKVLEKKYEELNNKQNELNENNQDVVKAIELNDRISQLSGEMAELDMFNEKDRKNIQKEYIDSSIEYNKITGNESDIIKDYKVNILDRDKSLNISFDTTGEPDLSNNQRETVQSLSNVNFNSKELDSKLKKYIKDDQWRYDFDSEDAKKSNLKEDDKIENPYKYINPKDILVLNDITKKYTGADLALMCNYRFDPEHGLAILFTKDGKVITIGQEDIAL